MIIKLGNWGEYLKAIKTDCSSILLVEGDPPAPTESWDLGDGLWWLKGRQMRHVGPGNLMLMRSYFVEKYGHLMPASRLIGTHNIEPTIYSAIYLWIYGKELEWSESAETGILISKRAGARMHILSDMRWLSQPAFIFSWGLGLFVGEASMTDRGVECQLMDYIRIEDGEFIVRGHRFKIPAGYEAVGNDRLLLPSTAPNKALMDPRIHIVSEIVVMVCWIIWRIWGILKGVVEGTGEVVYVHHDIDRRIFDCYGTWGIMGLVNQVLTKRATEYWVDGRWVFSDIEWLWEKMERACVAQRLIGEATGSRGTDWRMFLRAKVGTPAVFIENRRMTETEYTEWIEQVKDASKAIVGDKMMVIIADVVDMVDVVRLAVITNFNRPEYEAVKGILALKSGYIVE